IVMITPETAMLRLRRRCSAIVTVVALVDPQRTTIKVISACNAKRAASGTGSIGGASMITVSNCLESRARVSDTRGDPRIWAGDSLAEPAAITAAPDAGSRWIATAG